MLVIAILGHSKHREVHAMYIVHFTIVEMSYDKMGHWEWLYIIMCLCVFRDAKMVYPLQYREMYLHV